MNLLLDYLKFKNAPGNYGWFHILALLLVISAIVILCVFIKKVDEKKLKLILIITSAVMIGLEIYKQLTFSWNILDAKNSKYAWYSFPFQFCSTPMYVMLVAGLVKPGKFRDYLLSFLATFSLFGGLAVMLYPNDVFVTRVGIDVQTMVHHGSQVVIGLFLLIKGVVKPHWKTFLQSFAVFASLVIVALTLNLIMPAIGITAGQTFNMFFISPYHACTLPVLSFFYSKPIGVEGGSIGKYIGFFALYFIGFSLISIIILSVDLGITKLIRLIKSKKRKEPQAA